MAILNLFGGNKEKQDKARDKNRYEEEEDIKSRSSRRRKGEGDRERKSKSKSKSKNSEKEFDNFSKSKSSKARGEYETRERRETFSSKQRKKSRVPTEAAKWSESGYDDIILTEQEISYMKYKNKHRHRSNSLETRDTKQSKHEKREKGRSESRMKKHLEEEEHTKSHHRRHRSKSVVSRHNADEKQRSSSRYRKRSPSVHSKRKDERMENETNDKKRDKARSFSRSRRRSKSTIRSDYRSYDVPSTSKDHGRRDEISQRSKSRQRRRSASWDGYIKDVNGEKSRESKRNGQQTGYRDKLKHPVSDERLALSTRSPTYVRESKHEKQIKNGNSKEHSKEDGHREISRGRLKESNRYYDGGENMNGLNNNNETKSTSSVKKIVQRFNHKGMEETSARVTNIREGRGRIPKCALDKNVLSQIKSIHQDYDTSENVKAVAQHHNGKHVADTAARETRDDSVPLEGRDKDLKTSIDTSASKLSPIQQRWNCDKCGSANNSKGPFCVVCGGKSRNGNRGETGDPKINHVAPPNNQYRSSDEKFAKAQISLRSPTMNPEAWRCGSCGNVNENSRKSCVNCGNEKMFPSQTNMNYSTSDILIKGTGGEDALVASSETETSGHLRRPRTISPMTVGNETRGHIGAVLSYTPREDYPPSFRDHGDVDVAQLTISPKSSTFHGQRAWNKTESDQNLSILSNMSTPAASWLCNFCKLINTSSGPFCCQCGQNRNNNNVTTNGLAFVEKQEAVRDFDSNNSVSSRNDFSRCSPRDFMQDTVWKCRCLHVNDLTRKFCERCRGANPVSTFHQNMVVENDNFAAPLVQNHMWECSSCLRLNESQRSRCQFCGEIIKTMMAHNDSISVSSSLQSRTQKVNKPVEHVEKGWVCKSCSSYNFKDRKFCMNCGAKRILDENKDLKNVGTAASTRRDEGYFSQSNIMPRPIASYPTSSAQDYRSQELKMAIDGPYEQCQNYENHRYLSQNNQQWDQRHETRPMQMHEGQYRVNRADSDRVHTSTTQSVRSVDHGESQNMNTSLILPQKGQKGKENSGPMMRKTNMESYTTPQNNPYNDRNNSRIPKSALSLSVLADISSGKATLKKTVVESNKEEATTLLSQIKKGKNLKSVKGKMCDDRSPRKNDRPMTILDQIKSGPKLKKVEKSNPSNSSREDNNSSALGSIFARRKILVGSKQDSAKSEFDSEEWS